MGLEPKTVARQSVTLPRSTAGSQRLEALYKGKSKGLDT